MYISRHSWAYICACTHINTPITHMHMDACKYMYVFMLHKFLPLGIYIEDMSLHVDECLHMSVYIYAYMYICRHIYIYLHTYITYMHA